jgi:hypothetical protein
MTYESVRTYVLVPFACSPVCPDAQILNLSDSAQWAGEEGANAKALSGQHMTWRELEEALETSTNTDHVRRALALNKHLLHGQPTDTAYLPSLLSALLCCSTASLLMHFILPHILSRSCMSYFLKSCLAHAFHTSSHPVYLMHFILPHILSLDPSNTACP